MICYLGKTFCVADPCTCPPGRKLTAEILAAAKTWWGSDDAPISTAWVCGPVDPGVAS